MIKSILFSAVAVLGISLLAAFQPQHTVLTIEENTSVIDVLEKLGASLPDHSVRTDVQGVSAAAGQQLITEGIAQKASVGRSSKQSKHFVCTSCHNIEKEDPDLRYSNPNARLTYGVERDLPLLPGTTLYGIVNRKTFYNGDYEKKYGDLVKPARNDIRGAIALCATECAQGRELEDWEMESIMAYLWTIDLKMSDLNIPNSSMEMIETALNGKGDMAEAAKMVQSYFLDHSPATFTTPPPNRDEGYGLEGNADNGEKIYQSSCLHCHGEQRYSFFNLDQSKSNLAFMAKHFNNYTRYSAYQVVRYGTSPMNGKKAYMPHYTQERMSNQQVEDLKAYIMANK